MIRSFRHKGLKLLFEKGDRRKVQSDYADKIGRILARLEEASDIGNMDPAGLPVAPPQGRYCRLLVGHGVRQLACNLPL